MKKIIFAILLAAATTAASAQQNNFQLSSHILDVSKGQPATGVSITLEKYNEQARTWTVIDKKITDTNGRITDFLKTGKSNLGIYRLTYFTSDYFKKMGIKSFYPFIEVVFNIQDGGHYHVPITLSAYGYSTYRGN